MVWPTVSRFISLVLVVGSYCTAGESMDDGHVVEESAPAEGGRRRGSSVSHPMRGDIFVCNVFI